ncbi:hypothetical protein ACOMCU_00775 [Lysinibacillus sp. UGB7]|uniref:hypothetical protein n=1 Tax=Lysinibacillus sp. UGB7 TaxID=3411039 RepID=UPI003B766E15
MAYQKPICECGSDLRYSGQAFVILNVRSNGKISRFNPYLSTSDKGHLWCLSCKNYYAFELDEKERILRGKRIRSKENLMNAGDQ